MLSEELQVKLLELWKLGWLDPPCAVKQLNCLPFFLSYLHFLTFPLHVWVIFKHYPFLHLTRHSNLICILLKYQLLGYFELGSGSLGHLASQALRSRIKDETKKIKMCVYFPVQHLRSYIVLCRHDIRSPHLNLSTIASSVFSKMSNYPFKSDTYLIHSWKISEFPEFKASFPVIRFTAKISFKPVTRGAYRGGTCICTKHCTHWVLWVKGQTHIKVFWLMSHIRNYGQQSHSQVFSGM